MPKWETAKTALGKIYYKDDGGNQVTSYGLIAETIIGSLIMGERLKIKNANSTVELGAEGITIKQGDGTIVFRATPNGELEVRNYASQSSVDTLEASIEAQAGEIALKASQTTVDGLSSDLSDLGSTVNGLGTRLSTAESEITQNATDISAKVSQTYGNSSSSFGWSLKSSGFYVYSNASTVMKITSSGLEVEGKITANSGSIGGWTIDGYWLQSSGENGVYCGMYGEDHSTDKYYICTRESLVTPGTYSNGRFFAGAPLHENGQIRISQAKFVVTDDGSMYAEAAQISGEINATKGKIGDFTISSGEKGLHSSNLKLVYDRISFMPDGDEDKAIELTASNQVGYNGGVGLSINKGLQVVGQLSLNSGSSIYIGNKRAPTSAQIKVQTTTGHTRYLLFYNGILVGISGSSYGGVEDYSEKAYSGDVS